LVAVFQIYVAFIFFLVSVAHSAPLGLGALSHARGLRVTCCVLITSCRPVVPS
jgi:hypothetical protein